MSDKFSFEAGYSPSIDLDFSSITSFFVYTNPLPTDPGALFQEAIKKYKGEYGGTIK